MGAAGRSGRRWTMGGTAVFGSGDDMLGFPAGGVALAVGTGSPSSSHRSEGSGPISVGTMSLGDEVCGAAVSGLLACRAIDGGDETDVFCVTACLAAGGMDARGAGSLESLSMSSGESAGGGTVSVNSGCDVGAVGIGETAVVGSAEDGGVSGLGRRWTVGGCGVNAGGCGLGRGREGGSSSTDESVFWLGETFWSASPTVLATTSASTVDVPVAEGGVDGGWGDGDGAVGKVGETAVDG